ncbi:hypothetical protein ACFWYW_23745 [Nonomuraea sp. NPDC059023]|uniref:hypothetical protein n=1 Tax=unclassified Nonomuraea TaxID=2593643 RepID=UPI0036D08442
MTPETAQCHESRLREVIAHLPEGSRYLLISCIRVAMTGGGLRSETYMEPELEVRDHRGNRRVAISIESEEYRVALPSGAVFAQEPRQAAILVGPPS